MKNASKFSIATNKESKLILRTKALAAHYLTFSRWTPSQREILERVAQRGYLVGDIWAILDAFGLKPSWHRGAIQKGIILLYPSNIAAKNGKINSLLKKEVNFCLL